MIIGNGKQNRHFPHYSLDLMWSPCGLHRLQGLCGGGGMTKLTSVPASGKDALIRGAVRCNMRYEQRRHGQCGVCQIWQKPSVKRACRCQSGTSLTGKHNACTQDECTFPHKLIVWLEINTCVTSWRSFIMCTHSYLTYVGVACKLMCTLPFNISPNAYPHVVFRQG